MVALRFPFRKNKDKRKKKLSHYRKYTSKRIWSYFMLSFFGGQKRATRVEECECIDVGAIGRCRFKRSAGQEPSVRGGPPGWLTNRIRRYRRRRATGLGECCRGASWTRRRPVAATRGASRIPRWGPTRRATGPERGNRWKLGPSRAWPFSTLRAIFILIDDQEKKERNVNVERNAQGNKKKVHGYILRLYAVIEAVNPELRFLLLEEPLEEDGEGDQSLAVRRQTVQSTPVLDVHCAQRVVNVLGLFVNVAERSHW